MHISIENRKIFWIAVSLCIAMNSYSQDWTVFNNAYSYNFKTVSSEWISTTIFIDSMDDFSIINEIYEEAFGAHKPARATVAVKTLPKNALVEIDAVALVS